MSKSRKSAAAVYFAPELTIVLALVFLVALIAWYGKDWWAKLIAPFQYWGSSLFAIGEQFVGGDWYGAYLSLQGRIASAINAWNGEFAQGSSLMSTGVTLPQRGTVVHP
jgi:hypothetical protein